MLVAIACVVAGGPWFADGLRALRLRRLLARLRERPLDADCAGLVQVRGQVALESPLFAPLSSRRCAGFVLDVHGVGIHVGGQVRELREFQLHSPDGSARVEALGGRWQLPVTAEREFGPGEPLTENLATLFERSAELRWLKGRGVKLRVVERALESGATASVIGFARAGMAVPVAGIDLARTGTDGNVVLQEIVSERVAPSLHIGPADTLDLLVVGDRLPEPRRLEPPRWRTLGAILGPALCLAGLLYLAHAAGQSMAGRP